MAENYHRWLQIWAKVGALEDMGVITEEMAESIRDLLVDIKMATLDADAAEEAERNTDNESNPQAT